MVERHKRSRDRVKEKRRKKRASKRRGDFKYLLLLFLVLFLVWFGYKIVKSDFFTLAKITIQGNKHLSKKELVKMANLKMGSNLFTLNSQKAIDNIKSNNWVEQAGLQKRYFSGEVVIKVNERVPLGLINSSQKEDTLYLVDYDGYIIEEVKDIEEYELPTILEFDSIKLSQGERISNNSFNNMVKCLKSLDPFIRKQIQEITIESVDTLRLYTGDGVEILYGKAEDMQKKNYVLLRILKGEDSGKIIFIDLRSITNPVVKKLGEE